MKRGWDGGVRVLHRFKSRPKDWRNSGSNSLPPVDKFSGLSKEDSNGEGMAVSQSLR